MKQEIFDSILENRLSEIKKILQRKGKEYSSDIDRLHNFKVAARLSNSSSEKALQGMLMNI